MTGTTHLRTTAYHPQANEMVERFHRQLKTAIKCHETEKWTEVLPLVMLGIRTAYKEDLQTSPAEVVYGSQIHLPGEFFTPSQKVSESEFVKQLQQKINNQKPTPATRQEIKEHLCTGK